jgi:hypothetical protein
MVNKQTPCAPKTREEANSAMLQALEVKLQDLSRRCLSQQERGDSEVKTGVECSKVRDLWLDGRMQVEVCLVESLLSPVPSMCSQIAPFT